MTAVEPVLEVYIDLNIVLCFSALIWFATRGILSRTRLRFAFPAQLQLLKALFICVMISPALAVAASSLAQLVWPERAISFSDIAVAAYLRGDIAMPAIEFEALLNTRQRLVEDTLLGKSAGLGVIILLMMVGAAGFVVQAADSVRVIRRTVSTSYLWRQTRHVDIRLSDRVTVPFAVRGVFRRHVVLPSDLITRPREMRFALAHEFQHLREGDVEWELLLALLRPLFFWNPAFWLLKQQFDRLRELSCDQFVVTRNGMDATAYVTCLLDYCAQKVSRDGPRVMNVEFVNCGQARRSLRQRVLAIGNAPKAAPHASRTLIGLACLFAVCLSVGSAAIRQADDWSHDRLMLSTVVNLERLELINRRY